jgi:hypothetical protein
MMILAKRKSVVGSPTRLICDRCGGLVANSLLAGSSCSKRAGNKTYSKNGDIHNNSGMISSDTRSYTGMARLTSQGMDNDNSNVSKQS